MPTPEVPNMGLLLGPAIGQVPEQARPALLYGLERAAAAHYRSWSEKLPEHSDTLLPVMKTRPFLY